jgi:hypothetical protein
MQMVFSQLVFTTSLSHCLLTGGFSASAEAIARIYNLALGHGASDVGNSSRLSDRLVGEVVLDSFFLHALLRGHDDNLEKLSLPHGGLQGRRFDQALNERNYRMAGTGQEMWAHACRKCMYVFRGSNGNWCKSWC